MVMVVTVAMLMAVLAASALALAMGIAPRVTPDLHLLAALALTPIQTMIIAFMQAGSLATIMEFMQELNLLLISATL
ncbi:hypothetical protein [Pseudomonas sp. RIT-PI-q]|uniref:hypothetical protein n=1 Tax=Pseudomonas sp. RIT-PI-q TaxID=1690247 RepID=UPI000A6E66D4|nr:hypothetical protein [Pseudomonas sp. RIT-PI-q]